MKKVTLLGLGASLLCTPFLLLSQNALPEAAPYEPASDRQLMTLGKADQKRFPLTDITWPKEAGDAEVCLWKDDKYAAASIVIDDNCQPDHEFWLEQCRKHGIKVTFFVITGGVGVRTKPFSGKWSDWKKMLDSGLIAVQSHSVNHHSDDDKRSDDEVRIEYAASKKALEDNLPGNRCLTIATPYGKGKPEISGKYYIAVRGTYGMISPANQINYSSVAMGGISQGFIDVLLTGETQEQPKWLRKSPQSKRGWITPLYHFVAQGKKGNVVKDVENLAKYKDRIWIDTFPAVAKYGQERDSAELKVLKKENDRLEYALSDRMCDSVFDDPLTLKIRLPAAWKTVAAAQNGTPVEAKFLTHDGAPFALVQAVPDRGTLVVTEQPQK